MMIILLSTRKLANDGLWLYQHSARCAVAMQLFLDENSDYACFVPMPLNEIRSDGTILKPLNDRPLQWARSDAEVHFLVDNVPEPPLGFGFSPQQQYEQARFFKWAKDRIVPADNPDLYNVDLVAVCTFSSSSFFAGLVLCSVVPEQCSSLFGLFVESLLITHAECKLNQAGHLLGEYDDPNGTLPTVWCANLVRR